MHLELSPLACESSSSFTAAMSEHGEGMLLYWKGDSKNFGALLKSGV